jgi:asparagine synthase (glutamine-hydrolysing)
MCGINFIVHETRDQDSVRAALERMNRVIAHRGPDADVTTLHALGHCVVGMGHRRLSIIDTSHSADQPLSTPDGRYSLIFNGEIYNYKELLPDLGDDPVFQQTSGDTGVLLAALVRWRESALTRLNGMWGFVFVDWHEKKALISRDRLGKKPLYFHQSDTGLSFSSEVKGVISATNARFRLDSQTLLRFLVQSVTEDTDRTFFEGVSCVPAASFAWIDLCRPQASIEFKTYWRHPFAEGVSASSGSLERADVDHFRELLFDSVRLRLRADVPVGVPLSGGLDSSSVLAGIVAAGRKDVNAFSVVSDDPTQSEEPFIRAAAGHYGVSPHFINVDRDPRFLFDQISDVNWINDQPVSGMSKVAHYLMIRAARAQGIKVLLTGQGSDEQLAGYNKSLYLYLMSLARSGHLLRAGAVATRFALNNTVFGEFTWEEARRYIPSLRARGGAKRIGPALQAAQPATTGYRRDFNETLFMDLTRFSLPQLLHTEDRMSMASGVEMRVPFVDYRIVEFLARLPPEAKLGGGWTKLILREAMRDHLPEQITFRKDKKGFNVPEAAWFRTTLAPQVTELLSGDLCAESMGVFQPGAGRHFLRSWQSGSREVSFKEVFAMVSLELWLRRVEQHTASTPL